MGGVRDESGESRACRESERARRGCVRRYMGVLRVRLVVCVVLLDVVVCVVAPW